MNKFEKLAQANVDHYDNHPVTHTAIAVVSLVGAVVLTRKLAKRISREDPAHLKSGHMAN